MSQTETQLFEARKLLDAMAGGICLTDAKGKIYHVNRNFREWFFDVLKTQPEKITDVFSPLQSIQLFQNASETGQIQSTGRKIKIKIRLNDVVDNWFEYYSSYLETAECTFIVHQFHNLESSENDLLNLVFLHDHYTGLFESFRDVFYLMREQENGEFLVEHVSRNIFTYSGFNSIELIGKNPAGFYADPKVYDQIIDELKEKGAVSDREVLMIHKSGGKIWNSVSARLFRFRGQRYIQGAIRDISVQKNTEELLASREGFYRTLIENSMEATAIIDMNGKIAFVSNASKALMGYEPDYLKGRNVFDLIHPDEAEAAAEFFRFRVAEGGVGRRLDWRLRNVSGEYRTMGVMINNQLDNPYVRGLVINAVDVTQRVEAEKKIRDANKRLEKLNTINQLILIAPSIMELLDEVVSFLEHEILNTGNSEIFLWETENINSTMSLTENVNTRILKYDADLSTEFYRHCGITEVDVFEGQSLFFSEFLLGGNQNTFRSVICFPILAKDCNLGFLVFRSQYSEFFTKEIADFLLVVSNQISLGISDIEIKEKMLQKELEKSAIIDANPDLLARVSFNGELIEFYGKEDNTLYRIIKSKKSDWTNSFSAGTFTILLEMVRQSIENHENHEQQLKIGEGENTMYLEARISPLNCEEAIVLFRDITDKANTEISLKTRTSALEASPDALFIVDALQNKIRYANSSFFEFSHFSEEAILETPFLIDDESIFVRWFDELTVGSINKQEAKQALLDGKVYAKEFVISNPDLQDQWVLMTLYSTFQQGEISNYVIVFRDITELKLLEKRLLSSIVEAQEGEQKRIAADLHDGLGQNLTAINLYLNAVVDSNPAMKENELFTIARNLLVRSIQDTRQISHSLMPSSLELFGLINTVNNLVDSFNAFESGLKIRFTHNFPTDFRLKSSLEVPVFRIFQEILNNAIKHANAKEFLVNFMIKNDMFVMQCSDNGVGYDMNQKTIGMGLNNIRLRIQYCNGTLHTEAYPGKGSKYIVQIPMNQKL